jgi:MoxR-like ATPase
MTDEVLILEASRPPPDRVDARSRGRTRSSMQRAVKDIYVDPLIKQNRPWSIAQAAREHSWASPRGSLALYRTSQARALLDGRDFVIPDDVKDLAYTTLGHRVIVSPSARVKSITASDIVLGCLDRVPVPGTRARGANRASGPPW